MQDNKALQAGTSHNLGQNFAKAFELKFQSEKGTEEFAWNTSWGTSTRMVGGLIMTHSDDKGLVCPPRLAPIEVVIVPIFRTDEDKARVLAAAEQLKASLGSFAKPEHQRRRIHIDAREGMKPGAKYYEWELRGIPLRMELGPRDLDNGQCVIVRRDTGTKQPVPLAELETALPAMLEQMQADLFAAAKARREANSIRERISYDKFKEIMAGQGGFVYAGWCGDPAVEAQVKEETKATIRCIPDPEFRSPEAPTTCMVTGRPATCEVLWAKAY